MNKLTPHAKMLLYQKSISYANLIQTNRGMFIFTIEITWLRPQAATIGIYTGWPKKVSPQTFVHIFAKY